MNIIFEKVKIHHFLSFGEAEIDLRDKGFCMIKGVNHNPKDAAKSNGSGKSGCFNAILFALTGETAQGLKSNLGNIYFNDGCWVELIFKVDNTEYRIIRYKEDAKYGTNLKIWVDGEDKSGKGIRESQAVLDTLLPDLTSELLGSAIILGQGLPQRFTSNTPAKRKEILEHLTKSDFMIQEIKDKISKRVDVLNAELRSVEDNILALNTTKTVSSQQLTTAEEEYSKLLVPVQFDVLIEEKQKAIDGCEKLLADLSSREEALAMALESHNKVLTQAGSKMNDYLEQIRVQHEEITQKYSSRKERLISLISVVSAEIKQIESIKEFCPTCGQRIPGAHRPDASGEKAELAELQEQLNQLQTEINEDSQEYQDTINEIRGNYNEEVSASNEAIQSINSKLSQIRLERQSALNNLKINQSALATLKSEQEKYETVLNSLKAQIEKLKLDLKNLNSQISIQTKKQEGIQAHLEVITKITTLVRRDFRGFLLKNSIDFINSKAREYSIKIFNTDELEFVLDDNDINIRFCNKDYENLSGGEKQRVDLIINFAIRDLLCTYLNFSSNILVLDEITDALDAVSCDKVVKFITNELYDIESVFIISHHSDELMLPAENEIVIEKDIYGVSGIR